MLYEQRSQVDGMRMLFKERDGMSGREYLISSKNLNCFDNHMIEQVIIEVFSSYFQRHDSPCVIRVSRLVEMLEYGIRMRAQRVNEESSLTSSQIYPIGTTIVSFLEERGIITLFPDSSGKMLVQTRRDKESGKNHKDYIPCEYFAYCNFKIDYLPIIFNLPMICNPLDWSLEIQSSDIVGEQALPFLKGGYLSCLSGNEYNYFHHLSMGDIFQNYHYQLIMNSEVKNVLNYMNVLQNQSFHINTTYLNNIITNYEKYENYAYIMPRYLASMSIGHVVNIISELFQSNQKIQNICDFHQLLKTCFKNISRARSEQKILCLGEKYQDRKIYFPAYPTNHGRIYRRGLLHFHAMDLGRSILDFSVRRSYQFNIDFLTKIKEEKKDSISQNNNRNLYTKFENKSIQIDDILLFSRDYIHPFLYSKIFTQLFLNKETGLGSSTPIVFKSTFSLCSYQAMSYLLLSRDLGKATYLIPSEKESLIFYFDQIRNNLITYCNKEKVLSSLKEKLTTKIVKGLFDNLLCNGKSRIRTQSYLESHIHSSLIRKEDFTLLSDVFIDFFNENFSEIDLLIRLINSIGWLASAMNKNIMYINSKLITVQSFVRITKQRIDLPGKDKNRMLNVRVPSEKTDFNQTERATFINFLQHVENSITQHVIQNMIKIQEPIYNDHSKYYSTIDNSHKIGDFYIDAYNEMKPPLYIIMETLFYILVDYLTSDEQKQSVFTPKLLKTILRKRMKKPLNINPKIWESKINSIVNDYFKYTHIVCGKEFYGYNPQNRWLEDPITIDHYHNIKMKEFHKLLSKNWIMNQSIENTV